MDIFFWAINIVLLAIIIFLLLLLSMFWPPDSPWAPWWRTGRKTARAMCRLAKVGKDDIVYDLGSGDGTALIVAAKEFGAKGVGIEIDPLRAFISNMLLCRNGVSDRIRILKKNFYDADISKASVIFVYLVPRALERLRPKLMGELKPGTLLVSYKYGITLPLIRHDKKNDIYLYKINST